MKNTYLSFLLAALFLPTVTFAAEVQSVKNYTIEKEATIKSDLYVASNAIRALGIVSGDLLAVSEEIELSGTVSGDLAALSKGIRITGTVSDDVRIAAQSVFVDGEIAGDLIAFGATVTLTPKSVIKGDVFLYGGTIEAGGTVNGNLRIGAERASISGTVGGDAVFWGSSVTLRSTAVLKKDFSYVSERDAVIEVGAVTEGEITRVAIPYRPRNLWNDVFSLWLFALVVLALALYFLARERLEDLSRDAYADFWSAFSRGFLIAIFLPVLAIFLMLSLVGVYAGLAVLLAFILLLIISYGAAAVLLGVLVYKLLGRKEEYILDWKAVILGVASLHLLAFIPYVGVIAVGVFVIASFGIISGALWKALRGGRGTIEESEDNSVEQ